jgi:hypothetical protein
MGGFNLARSIWDPGSAGGLAHNRSQALAIDRLRRDANYRQALDC